MAQKRVWIGVALIGLAVAIVYGRAVSFGFTTFDDGIHVYDNPYLSPATLRHCAHFWKGPYKGLYVPLTYTSWSVESAVARWWQGGGPVSPGVFHFGNICLHGVNAALVFLILFALVGGMVPALAGALLFAWHPVQVEPVAWISGRKDVLCGFFSLLCLWQAIRFMQAEPAKRRQPYLFALAAYLCALLAKPVASALPLMLMLVDIGLVRRSWRDAARAWAPWLIAVVPLAWLTKTQQPDSVMTFVTPWAQRPWIAADALVFYLSRLLFPLFLTLNYGRTPEWVLAQPWHVWEAGLLVLLVGLAWLRPSRQWWLVAIGLFCANLLPVLGFVPFYYQVFSTVADRFLYLSLLGPALLLAKGLQSRGHLKTALCALVLAWMGAKSVIQTHVWQNNQKLVEHIARWNPNDPDIQYSLGVIMSEASKPPGQASYYTRMLRLPPSSPDPRERLKKFDEAVFHYREALRIDPRHIFAHNNLGLLLSERGDWREAAAHFQRALEIEPGMLQARNNLGVALAQGGEIEEAIRNFSRAIEIAPDFEGAHMNLGLALEQRHDLSGARREYARALTLNPTNRLAREKLAATKTL